MISHAIAPSFLLGAVAGFSSILSLRMTAILERLRTLNAISDSDQDRLHLKADIPRLQRRANLVNQALVGTVVSGILAAVLVIFAFTAALLGINHVLGEPV